MASNFASIWTSLTTALEGVSELETVWETPLSDEEWLKNFTATVDNTPAAHLCIRDEGKPQYYTSGDIGEILPIRITIVYQDAEATAPMIYAVRDAVISALEADQSLGGYANGLNLVALAKPKVEGFSAVFTIDYDIAHEWAL